tara:strand:+ start:3207 stop:5720 length:2514 start_codon:yes stop_codon:yes gene_type:complete
MSDNDKDKFLDNDDTEKTDNENQSVDEKPVVEKDFTSNDPSINNESDQNNENQVSQSSTENIDNTNQEVSSNEENNKPKVENESVSLFENKEDADIETNQTENNLDNENQDQTSDLSSELDQNVNVNIEKTEEDDINAENQNNNDDKNERNKVIHKKDGRLHIYVRQDKYKGELKSKNWVGRIYIDGKQKIFSSGTQNLDEAVPILEKWFDDIHEQKAKEKENEAAQADAVNQVESNVPKDDISMDNLSNNIDGADSTEKKDVSIFGKLKNLKIKKPSLNFKSEQKINKNPIKSSGFSSKLKNFFKSKLGKSSIKGEEIVGVELSNKEIRLVQLSSNKSNQWVVEKFYIHPVDVQDDSTPLENADKFSEELSLALQKSKISTANAAIAIPVTSAIIRVVTAPLMKDEELQKAIETNSLWENLVQLTDSLDDYSIFHQVINRNQTENTMDILFVASKLSDINNYTSIIKNAGLNPVIIDVKCFALKSAVDQINQLTHKTEDANLTAVLEFGLDENYLMILYDNNPIITDIFIRGLDRKILQESDDAEEKEGLVRRYVTQVKQAIQDFETKYEKRIRNIKVVSDIENVEDYLASFRKNLVNVGFMTFDPVEGLKIPNQFQQSIDTKQNKSYLTTAIGLAFRKLDVFGYYKFVTAVKNINLLPDRSNVMKQKKMSAISNFAFKGVVGTVVAVYIVLFGLSFWNIQSYNNQLVEYSTVKAEHARVVKQKKTISKELKFLNTSLKLSRTLKSNKELTYRVLAQVASSVPNRVKFDQVEFTSASRLTIQGIAASDQDILKFIDNLGKQKLIEQASLSSMRLPKTTAGGATMKGFRVFVKFKRG